MQDAFLNNIRSDNAEVRFAAWRGAGQASPSVIPELGKLMGSENPGVRKAAREALAAMTHAVGKDGGPRRAEVVKGLLAVASGNDSIPARAEAFRLLSLVAVEDSVAAIARFVHDGDLREEAVYCLERIPGNAAVKALAASYRDAKEDFKPRILAALGHRRADEGVTLCVEAMRSPNKDLAMAAMKAFGRIGRKSAGTPRYPDASGLSEWQKIEHMDSQLRWADAQAAAGNHADAMRVYKTALERAEPHWQCAGIVGIARLGTADAAAAIFPLLRSNQPQVRITAANAWRAMADRRGA